MKYTIPLSEDKIRSQSNKMLFGGGVVEKGIPPTATNYWGLSSNRGRHLRAKANMEDTETETPSAYTFFKAISSGPSFISSDLSNPSWSPGTTSGGFARTAVLLPFPFALSIVVIPRQSLIGTFTSSLTTLPLPFGATGLPENYPFLVTKYNGIIRKDQILGVSPQPDELNPTHYELVVSLVIGGIGVFGVPLDAWGSSGIPSSDGEWLDVEFTILESPGDANSTPLITLT